MYLIDSHCHLYAKNFEDDIEEVVQQSINNNVKKYFYQTFHPKQQMLCLTFVIDFLIVYL